MPLDVVTYYASGQETHACFTPNSEKQFLLEVYHLGQKGLKINDPDARLQLRILPTPEPLTALQHAWLLFSGH